MSFPIHRASYRTLDPDWEGEVFIADIDRTYLATHFSSLKGMARIPFERAAEKEDIAGMSRLLREIRRGPREHNRHTPLFFVSASPSQLRPVIEQKLALDGIGFDGTTFKNWGGVLRRMKLSRFREQVGFKLTALLAGRAALPVGAAENLIGDDLETDPVTFALYADILGGRIPTSDLPRVLGLNGVSEVDARAIAQARRDLRAGRGVRRIFIRMERHADPDYFRDFAPGLVACRGAFQMSVAMHEQGSVTGTAIGRIAADLIHRGLDPAELAARLRDLCARAILTPQDTMELGRQLSEQGLIARMNDPGEPDPAWEAAWKPRPMRLWTPARYVGE